MLLTKITGMKMIWFVLLLVYTRLTEFCAAVDICETRFSFQWSCYNCCYGTPLSVYSNVQSAMVCSKQCTRDTRCRSIQFNPETKICKTNEWKQASFVYGCTTMVQYGEILKGRCRAGWLLEPCSTDGQCPISNSSCKLNRCECNYGYPYDYMTDSCPAGCTTYGNTFREVTYYLTGLNNLSQYDLDIEQCHALCVSTTGFTCRLIEYEINTKGCFLSELNAVSTPGAIVHETDANFREWDRNCA